MLGARNLELQLPIETADQAHQLDIPTQPDRTDPIFELAIEVWPRKPTLVPGALPYGENERQWLNSFFFGKPGMAKFIFFWASQLEVNEYRVTSKKLNCVS